MDKRSSYVSLGMSRGPLASAPALITAALLLFGCGGNDSDGSVARNEGVDTGEPLAPAFDGPDDVVVGDPFLTQLDHVWAGPAESGLAIVGYDANDIEIGRISIHSLGPDMLRITHRYPRPCNDPVSGEISGEEDCADVWDIIVRFAGEPEEHWADVYQTLPASVLLQRMQAMEIMAENQPQEFGERVGCALTIAAATSLCLVGSPTFPVGGAVVCAGSLYGAVCKCKAQLKKAFPDLDVDKICNK